MLSSLFRHFSRPKSSLFQNTGSLYSLSRYYEPNSSGLHCCESVAWVFCFDTECFRIASLRIVSGMPKVWWPNAVDLYVIHWISNGLSLVRCFPVRPNCYCFVLTVTCCNLDPKTHTSDMYKSRDLVTDPYCQIFLALIVPGKGGST